MSLEQELQANTAAIEALTAALKGAGTAPADKPAAAPKTEKAAPKGKAKKSEHTLEEAQKALIKIKDDFDMKHAKDVLGEFGIDKMANIPEDKIDAIYDAAIAKHAELSDEGGGGSDL